MRYFAAYFVVLVALVAMGGPAVADSERSGAYHVVEPFVVFDGVSCDGSAVTTDTDPRHGAAGAADKNSAPIAIGNTHQHSLSYVYAAENAGASFTLTLQHRRFGTWLPFSPAIAVTCSGSSGSGTVALNLPAAAEIRIVRSCDATYITTLTGCGINKF